MNTISDKHRMETIHDSVATSNQNQPIGIGSLVLVSNNNEHHILNEVLSVLESRGLLNDKKFCLQLVAELTERVAYQSAGYTSTSIVAELIMMSARASKLAKQLDKID